MYVLKRSGEREEYDPVKVKNSLVRSGLSGSEADRLVEMLRPQLYEGISTEEIYRRLNKMLDSERKVRFGLRKAILNLGPDGFFFEDFISRLFSASGHSTLVRQSLKGRCVTHEVDLVLEKGGRKAMVECKFHNSQGIKCSIQTALYTYGRFLDLGHVNQIDDVWLVTNTRFSSDVTEYAKCMNMKLIGWKYPDDGGLETLVERHGLYPITVLDLRRSEVRALLDNGILLVSEMDDKKDMVKRLLPGRDVERMVQSATALNG